MKLFLWRYHISQSLLFYFFTVPSSYFVISINSIGHLEFARDWVELHWGSTKGRVLVDKFLTSFLRNLVIGSFSIDDVDDRENVTFKMNSRFLKLGRVYSNSLKMSNVGEFPWG